jgi:hypothetical protein
VHRLHGGVRVGDVEPDGELLEERPVDRELDAVEVRQPLGGVARPGEARAGEVAQPLRAEPREVDQRRHGVERLVRADVRRRAFAADVLLARAQRHDVAARPAVVEVSPTIRPGSRRTCPPVQARNPNVGPP